MDFSLMDPFMTMGFGDPFFDSLLVAPTTGRTRRGGGGVGGVAGGVAGGGGQGRWYPMDVVEHEDRYSIVADAPGMTAEDIHIALEDDGSLNVRGKKRHAAERERKASGRAHVYERPWTIRFNRSFVLPDDARVDGIKATIENGVLTVDIPKMPKQERPGPKRIQVQAGGAAPMGGESVGVTTSAGVAGTTTGGGGMTGGDMGTMGTEGMARTPAGTTTGAGGMPTAGAGTTDDIPAVAFT